MKRIVICCDGTWNHPDELDGRVAVPTNVAKIAGAIDRQSDVPQMMYYDVGIGTTGSRVRQWFDGYSGAGIARIIKQAYRFIITNFEVGDQLFLFGFSRGAFTVRSLAGLVRTCGVLCRDALDLVDKAFHLYRDRSSAMHPRAREAVLFRRTYAVEEVTPIEFIGVWDTVGALGNPLLFGTLSPGNRFHDTDLSTTVRHAYQALAIDEKRRWFEATLWHQQPDAVGQVLEQQWFPGVHSNVGGGYADAGLADLALDWLVARATACGLGVTPPVSLPDPLAPTRESRHGVYRLLPAWYRPIDASQKGGPTFESLHPSALIRYARDPLYRPRNLEDYFRRHPEIRP